MDPSVSEDATEQGPSDRSTILVVDDEEPVRTLVKRVLESRGYRVLEAGDGAEALRVAEAYPSIIHLLLTDIVMPHGNGVSLSRTLVAKRPEMSVIYMSGYRADTLLLVAEVVSPKRLLTKPFTVEALVDQIQMTLNASMSKR